MKYENGQRVMLGDVVKVGLHNGDQAGRVVIIGDTGEYADLDPRTAQCSLESGHVGDQGIMVEGVESHPLAHDDPKHAPVSNTLSTSLRGVIMIRRKDQPH